jgi:hydrogenase nickel incorporation protein HypA/HybF
VRVHELSMCEAIARKVVDRADGRPVARVVVRIGHLRQVVPDAMTFSWELLTASTELDGAELEIEHVPAVVECSACAAVTTLTMPVLACAACGSIDVTLSSGDELLLVSFETVEGLDHAPVGEQR